MNWLVIGFFVCVLVLLLAFLIFMGVRYSNLSCPEGMVMIKGVGWPDQYVCVRGEVAR